MIQNPFFDDDSEPGFENPFAINILCKISVDIQFVPRCAAGIGNGVSDIALAGVKGALSTVTLDSTTTVEAAGIAGAALGALFLVLDFANGNWIGGAIGALLSPLVAPAFGAANH